MGLDKKPTPPKRIRNDPLVSKSWEKEKEEENHSKSESSQSHDTETKRDSNQEHKHKDGYEEDFEADDEGPMEDGVEEGKETSPSLSREEEDKRRKDENDNLNRNKVRGSPSVSSGLSSSSSSSEEDENELDEEQKEEEVKPEKHTDALTSEKDAEETENLQMSSVSLPTEDETQNQETEQTERVNGGTEEPREAEEPRDAPIEAEEQREEPGEAEEPREDLRAGTAGDVNKEGDRARSVQETLAAAILNMTECVSEPELSDTTTEEDELVSVMSRREGPGAEPENIVAQQTADEVNGSEPVQEAERDEAHTEEPKEELEKETHETPQPETIKQEEEKDTKQTEGTIQYATNEDESVQDEQNSGDENEDQKPEVKQDTTDEEEGRKQELNNNFTNEENKSNEEPEMMKEPEDEELPDGEVPKSEESFGQKPEKEATSEKAEETRATPVEEEVNMIDEITELQPENPEEISMNHENVDQNTVKEKIDDEELNGGEEVSADDKVSEEVRADDEETFDEESRNRRNNSEETGNDIAECVEGIMEDTELELKGSAVNEVISEDVASEDKKSEERLEVFVTEGEKQQREDRGGVETDVRDGMEKTKVQDPQVKEDENTDEGNKDEEKINKEMTEDNAEQNEPTPPGQTSEEKAENDVGKREEEKEEELAAEKDAELKDRDDDENTEELKEKESLKETEAGENEVDYMSDGGEERTDVGGADAEMQKIVTEQEDDNKEEQKDNSDPTVHEALQETTGGPGINSGDMKAENGEETINVEQEEPDKKEEAGPEEGEGTSETNEEEIIQDMTKEEGVKDERMEDDNEKEQDQREIQQETTNEEEEEEEIEEQEVGEEEIKQKQQTTNEEEVKDEQKDESENIKPLISENINDAATEDEVPSDTKSPAEDPAGAESEPKDTNVDLESRGEGESRSGDGNHIQSSTDIKKDKSADVAEETRSVEGSTSPSEESQPLEKVLAFKREEREAELIVAPQTDHEELVSNWVNVHQASNYFETFVEPLDEIKLLDGEMTVNAEALEIDETILSPKESHRNEESCETDKISLPGNIEREELEDTVVENINMETEALEAEGQTNPFSSNSAEEEEDRRQMDSEQTSEDVAVNNVMNISATPLMKIEISQDS